MSFELLVSEQKVMFRPNPQSKIRYSILTIGIQTISFHFPFFFSCVIYKPEFAVDTYSKFWDKDKNAREIRLAQWWARGNGNRCVWIETVARTLRGDRIHRPRGRGLNLFKDCTHAFQFVLLTGHYLG